MLHAVATLTYMMLLAGVLLRRRRTVHMPLMGAAMSIDLILVLYIECTRAAIERVAGRPTPLVVFHAAVSTLVLGLYAAMAVLGNRLRGGAPPGARWRNWHRRTGYFLVVCRTANYATSWML